MIEHVLPLQTPSDISPVPTQTVPVRQVLSFVLGGEEYGVDILRVQEIKRWERATRLPHAPPHVRGVINLRGEIVPVADLRLRFGLPAIPQSATAVMIVLQTFTGERTRIAAALVDAVCDVYHIPETEVQPPPTVGSVVDRETLAGLATVDGRMLILVDVDRLLALDGVAGP